jgi:hypothetical protein
MGARSFGAEPTEIQALEQSWVYEKNVPAGVTLLIDFWTQNP